MLFKNNNRLICNINFTILSNNETVYKCSDIDELYEIKNLDTDRKSFERLVKNKIKKFIKKFNAK